MADDRQQFSLSPVRPEYVIGLSTILCQMEPWLTLEYTPEDFESYLLHPDPALARHAVMISGEVAGVLSIRHPWLFGPLIELLALFDGFRGQGTGKRILRWASEQCEDQNLWVTVSSINTEARKFYEREGFEKAAILEDLIKPGWNELLLRKKILRPD